MHIKMKWNNSYCFRRGKSDLIYRLVKEDRVLVLYYLMWILKRYLSMYLGMFEVKDMFTNESSKNIFTFTNLQSLLTVWQTHACKGCDSFIFLLNTAYLISYVFKCFVHRKNNFTIFTMNCTITYNCDKYFSVLHFTE